MTISRLRRPILFKVDDPIKYIFLRLNQEEYRHTYIYEAC